MALTMLVVVAGCNTSGRHSAGGAGSSTTPSTSSRPASSSRGSSSGSGTGGTSASSSRGSSSGSGTEGTSTGTTISAASCAQAEVENAIGLAGDGDTVSVPQGSCTWSGLTITGTKGITLAGGNGGPTTIAGAAALSITQSATTTTRVTGFGFTGVGTDSDGDISAAGTPADAPFRIDHNTFTNSAQSVFIAVSGNASGLIDHNTFSAGGASEIIHNLGLGQADESSWEDDVTPGGSQMVFIEDNTFDNTDTTYIYSAVEWYAGARTVFRHNVVSFAQVDQHGTAGMVGARWYEVYENTFQPNGLNQCCYGAFRAGSGVIFNNHVVGSTLYGPGGIDLYEEDTGAWPLAYQVGSGIHGETDQHPTCTSPTRNSSPAYLWGNDATITIGSQTSSLVAEGRDYFVSATQPTTMVRQELSTDSCSTTYTYAPYAYPHPLQAQ